jgi:WD40 repeat protein
MFWVIQQQISQPKTLLPSIAPHRVYSVSDLPLVVHLLSLVSFFLFNFFFLFKKGLFHSSGHNAPILCASFSPTGNLLATGSGDSTARLWDLNTETPSHVLTGHAGWVLCAEWEPMERKLATGGHDSFVRLWDPRTGKPIGDALRGHTKWITSLAWEPTHM